MRNVLLSLPKARPDWTFFGLVFDDGVGVLPPEGGVFERIQTRRQSGSMWDVRGLHRATRGYQLDALVTHREIVSLGAPPTLLHIAEPPHYRLRRWRGRKAKAVVRDLMLAGTFARSLRRAAWLTAGGDETADWIQDRYGVTTQVVSPGVDPFFLEAAAPEGERDRFLLHLTSGDTRDNTDMVLSAFDESGLRERGVSLVVVGAPPTVRERIERVVSSRQLDGAVRLEGWVSDERLRDLYASAIALVHPSAFEAFVGLQPLEAMAQGTPVVIVESPGVSAQTPGCLVAEPDDASLAEALRAITADRGFRDLLGLGGQRFARSLTWAAASQRFAEILSRADGSAVKDSEKSA
jgi:glycosyltransferase involved in cell wall biosynthesis